MKMEVLKTIVECSKHGYCEDCPLAEISNCNDVLLKVTKGELAEFALRAVGIIEEFIEGAEDVDNDAGQHANSLMEELR